MTFLSCKNWLQMIVFHLVIGITQVASTLFLFNNSWIVWNPNQQSDINVINIFKTTFDRAMIKLIFKNTIWVLKNKLRLTITNIIIFLQYLIEFWVKALYGDSFWALFGCNIIVQTHYICSKSIIHLILGIYLK